MHLTNVLFETTLESGLRQETNLKQSLELKTASEQTSFVSQTWTLDNKPFPFIKIGQNGVFANPLSNTAVPLLLSVKKHQIG